MKMIAHFGGKKRRRSAVTPAIATMLLLVMIITVTMVVLVWGLPKIQSLQSEATFKVARSYFESLDENVYSLSKGNVGDSVSSNIKFSEGSYSIRNNVDFWVIMYQLSSEYIIIFEDLEDGDDKVIIYEANGKDITEAKVNVSWPLRDAVDLAKDQIIVKKPATSRYYFTTEFAVDSATKFTVNYKGINIAEAWVIALDEISIKMETAHGGFEINEINNALTSDYPSNNHVESGPDFYLSHDSRTFVANFAKFDINGVSVASKGSYSINLNLKDIGIGTNPRAMNLRMDFTGEYRDAWLYYFRETFSPDKSKRDECLRFIQEGSIKDFDGLLLDAPDLDDPFATNMVNFKIRINLIDVQTEAIA